MLASRAAAGPHGAATRAAGAHLRATVRAAVKFAGLGRARVSRVAEERAPAWGQERPRWGHEARERAPVWSHGARPSASADTGPGVELCSQGMAAGVGPSAFVSAGKGVELDSQGAAAAGVTGRGRRRSSTRRREAWARPPARGRAWPQDAGQVMSTKRWKKQSRKNGKIKGH